MRVLIGGSRSITDRAALEFAIAGSGVTVSEVITGNSTGADGLASQWATDHGIPLTVVPLDWAKHGGRAEMVRNEQAALMAESCIMVWDGFSRGTAHMIDVAKRLGLDLFIYECNPQRPSDKGKTRIHRATNKDPDKTPPASHGLSS